MKAPTCPSCRERLSDAEAGLVGVWSCLYCEGAWFSGSHSSKLQIQAREAPRLQHAEEAARLQCPSCNTTDFRALANEDLALFECRSCHSTFMPKKTVVALGSALGGGQWRLGEALAVLLGRSQSTKVDAAILVAAVAALLFA